MSNFAFITESLTIIAEHLITSFKSPFIVESLTTTLFKLPMLSTDNSEDSIVKLIPLPVPVK